MSICTYTTFVSCMCMVRHTDVVYLQRKIAFLVFSKLHGFELERDRKLFSVCFLSFCRFSLFCFGLWFVFRYIFFWGNNMKYKYIMQQKSDHEQCERV